MLNKNVLLLVLFTFFLISILPTTNAYFFLSHEYWTLKGFEEVDSPMTQMCRPYLNSFITGVEAADVPVIHYFDNKVSSYIGTHSLGSGLQACLDRADNDEERCFCYGLGLHWSAQDRFSHNEGGLVHKYLKSYFALNFLGHMVIENNFQKQHMDLVKDEPIVVSGQLSNYDSTALDGLFEETSGNPKLLEILSDQAGIDMTNDARIFRAGYQGEGFYSTVYQDKISLPWWFWAICIVLIGLGLVLIFIALKFGQSGWKWLIFMEGFILVALGLIILFSIFTGTTWKATTVLIEVPPKFGYLKVSDADVRYYNTQVQQATNDYLRTGQPAIDDASGLSFVDSQGVKRSGALNQAQKGAFIVFALILLLLVLSNIALIKKSLSGKSKKSGIFVKLGLGLIIFFVSFITILLFYLVGALLLS